MTMPSLRIRNILFDVDGTLLDSRKDIAGAQLYVLRKLGITHLTPEDIYPHIGKPLSDIFAILLPPERHRDIPRAKETYVTYYRSHALDTTTLFPGVAVSLAALHENGIRLGVATTKSSVTSARVLAHFGVQNLFTQIQGSDEMPFKPDPFILNKVIADQGWLREETMMVGDTAADILAGRNAHIRTCGVTWGALNREQMLALAPDMAIDRFDELLTIVGSTEDQ
jgi:phosphoglycolate phosphatase-like HAD superfamily hydrolase